MNIIRKLAVILVVIIIISIFANLIVCASNTPPLWNQTIFNTAMSINPSSMKLDLDFTWNNTLYASEAMYMVALIAYYDPFAMAYGKTASKRLIEHIRKITQPGCEPSCRGGLGGWIDNPVAQALVLAKNTPEVWYYLGNTPQETLDLQQRCDFIMKCMAVVGNYTQNYYNNVMADMSQTGLWAKGYNPNHQEGYVGIMIASYLYFGGADQVNSIFSSFDYDEYIAKMDHIGYANVKYYFERTGKELLESGGIDCNGGTAIGAKIPFTYKCLVENKRVEYEPFEIYKALSRKMYYYNVVNKVPINKIDASGNPIIAQINSGAKSPYEGLKGMAYEFHAYDNHGIRSKADYVFKGWRNSIPTRATMAALGFWQGEGINEIESRMHIGTQDYLFKINDDHDGYYGYSNGIIYPNETETRFINIRQGHELLREIWDNFLKKEMAFEAKITKYSNVVSAEILGYNLSLTENQKVLIIMAVYDKNELVDIKITPLEINKLSDSSVIANMNITLPNENAAVKLFIWDKLNEMQPLNIYTNSLN